MRKLFTSESVTEGHPDKICDQISDAVLDAILAKDPMARVACETMTSTGLIMIAGEITTNCYVDLDKIARETVREIGYDRAKYGFDCDSCSVLTSLKGQSPDIAQGVNSSLEARNGEADSDDTGAGDQGMMFGYATDETPEMLPIPYAVATHALELLRELKSPLLLPDAKAQVSYDYDTGRITTFLISTQHREDTSVMDIRPLVEAVMETAAQDYDLNTDFEKLVNPTGRFVVGSSFADSGLTGRKIIADTYGGMCRHGGGAFSGKDPTKVDRSGAYMARKIAKDLVRSGQVRKCEVQLAYAIGVAEPVSVAVECFGTERVSLGEIKDWIRANYNLTPAGIIKELGLLDVDYNQVSAYGHFGKAGLPWEE